MKAVKLKSGLTEAIICSLSLMLFSFFIQADWPLKTIAILSLLFPAYSIGKNTTTITAIRKITGENNSSVSVILYTIVGLTGGVILVILYRWHLDQPLMPSALRSFVFFAALIGCTEELVFRGYLQGLVMEHDPAFSVLFSSASHTLYKCCLFISPFSDASVDIGFLAFWTFAIGIIYGIIRQLSGSLLPSLVSHALFDILVYGSLTTAPWWVW